VIDPTSATLSTSTRSSTSLAPSAAVASKRHPGEPQEARHIAGAEKSFHEGGLDQIEIGRGTLKPLPASGSIVAVRRLPLHRPP